MPKKDAGENVSKHASLEDGEEEDEAINLRFVLPAGKTEMTAAESLVSAYCMAEEGGLKPCWVREEEVLNISPTKTDVFVLDPFSGPAFDHLSQGDKYKCTIIGPRCLMSCIQSGVGVPNLPYPLFTTAMTGLDITCSGFEKKEKERIKLLVERMSGVFSPVFHDSISHLVTNTVTSRKYEVAVESEICVMTKEWVEEVWRASCNDYITATDPRFLRYKCPVFLNLTVTVSGLSKSDKEVISKKITLHGGAFSPDLNMNSTNVLICLQPSGTKYTYAQKWRIPCLTPAWVLDSVDRGYAQPQEKYKVSRDVQNKASTPTKQDCTAVGLNEVSMCSTIMNPDETINMSKIDETVNSTALGFLDKVRDEGSSTAMLLQQLDLARVKKSGLFLDNLKIFLSGFSEADQVLLTRVLKFAGATRFTQLVESVSHVVNSPDGRAIAPETQRLIRELGLNPHCVSLEWVVESMKRGCRVPEVDFAFPPTTAPTAAATATTVTITNKASGTKKSTDELPEADRTQPDEQDSQILAEYRNTTDGTLQASSQIETLLSGLKFELQGLGVEQEQELVEWIGEAGGEVVFSDYTGTVDYLVTPISGGAGKHRHKEHVSSLWVDECLDSLQLLPIAYYHRPLNKQQITAVLGVVTCVSGYQGREREYISELVRHLGAEPQEVLAKRANKEKAVLATTHLVCPLPEGAKYEAALKWGIPVVTKDWLLACLRDEVWVCEKSFLVGEATACNSDKPMPRQQSISDDSGGDVTVLQEVDQNSTTALIPHISRNSSGLKSLKDRESAMATPINSVSVRNKSLSLSGKSAKDSPVTFSTMPAKDTHVSTKLAMDSPVAVTNKLAKDSPASSSTAKMGKPDTASFSTPVAVDRTSRQSLADTPGPNLDTPTIERLRPKPLLLEDTLTTQHWQDSQPSPSQHSVGKRKRDAWDDMPTPTTPYGAHLSKDPSPGTRKYYKRMLDKLAKLKREPTPAEKREVEAWLHSDPQEAKSCLDERKELWQRLHLRRDVEEEEPPRSAAKAPRMDVAALEELMEARYKAGGRSWKNIGEVASRNARERLQAMDTNSKDEEEEEITCHKSSRSRKVLDGAVVCIARKLSDQTATYESIVSSLGGQAAAELSPAVTHFIFEGKQRDLSREFRTALELGVKVVSPYWLLMCRDEGKWAPEDIFPHTYNPKMKLDFTEIRSTQKARPQNTTARSKGLPQPVFQDEEHEKNVDSTVTQPREGGEEEEDVTVMLEANGEDGNSRGAADFKDLERLLDSVSNSPAPTAPTPLQSTTQLRISLTDKPTQVASSAKKEQVQADPKSQVFWIDPAVENRRTSLEAKLRLETQKVGNETDLGSLNFENMSEMMITDTETTTHRVFLASGLGKDKTLEEAVAQLGGAEILDLSAYDDRITHMVAGQISRSEKLLGSIAGGKWVLHPSYVKDSLAAGSWLKEEEYEWGNPLKDFVPLTNGSMEAKLATSARRTRQARMAGEASPFSGFRVHLCLASSKKASFARLIAAGGGEVVDVLPQALQDMTHILAESKLLPHIQGKYESLAEMGIPVLQPLFLNDFLTRSGSPVDTHLMEEFRPFWDKKKRSRITTDTPTNPFKKSKKLF